MAHINTSFFRAATSAAALLTLAGAAQAQVWALNAGTLSSRAEAYTERNLAVLCNIISNLTVPPVPVAPGFLGSDFGAFNSAGCGNLIFTCPLSAGTYGDIRVDGVGSALLRMRWRSWASTRHVCPETTVQQYRAYAEMRPFVGTFSLDTVGVPPGTNVPIAYAWTNNSAALSKSEAGVEDLPTFVSGTALSATGVGNLFALGGFNFDVAASGFRFGGAGGNFNQVAGTPWVLAITGDQRAEIRFPGKGFAHKDGSGTYHYGEIWLTLDPLGSPIPPGIGFVPNPTLEFSLDIGSDTELSPPLFDGDEVFDPGDVYPWFGPIYAGPTDGPLDDATIFPGGIDVVPDPNMPIGPPNSAPTCTGAGVGGASTTYFDLDDTDRTDFNVGAFVDPILPGLAPINAFNSACVWEATNLIWSYDDDEAAHFVGLAGPFGACTVPVTSLSPILFQTWGQTTDDDEVLSGIVIPGALPTTLGAQWGVASETQLHPNLGPNPDLGQADDDDVDGLDVVGDVLADGSVIDCPFWYFSADHEAISPLLLDPGDIYLVTAAGPVLAVDDVVHLGIADSCDVDAFEFAFTPDPGGNPGLVLAVLFSVDDDDPQTPLDESGGLDPAMVYVSTFQGFSVPFLTAPLDDDIDALSVYADALPPVQIVPNEACCFCAGACSDLTPNDCLIAGGIPQGPGTVCAAGVCEPYGACCFAGLCVDNMTPTSCANNNGAYQGDCVVCAVIVCPPTGACCFACSGGAPTPPCPDPSGPTLPCQIVTAAQCASQGGVYAGDNTGCVCCPCPGDINGDGKTNVLDFNILAVNFGGGIPNCRSRAQGDLNCDGLVNVADFNILAGNFGCQRPAPPVCP